MNRLRQFNYGLCLTENVIRQGQARPSVLDQIYLNQRERCHFSEGIFPGYYRSQTPSEDNFSQRTFISDPGSVD